MKRRWMIILTMIALFVVVVSLLVVPEYIKRQLVLQLNEINGVTCRDVQYDFWLNQLTLDSLTVSEEFRPGLKGLLNEIKIKGFHRWKYWQKAEIEIMEIIGSKGKLELHLDKMNIPTKENDSSKVQQNLLFHQFDLSQLKIVVYDQNKFLGSARDIHIRLNEVIAKDGKVQIQDHYAQVNGIHLELVDNPHEIVCESLEYHSYKKILNVINLHMTSTITKEDWFAQVIQKQNRYDITIPEIEILKFDFRQYIEDDIINIGKLKFHKPVLEVFEDKRFKHCSTCETLLPQQAFFKANQKLNIDSIQFLNGEIHYIVREKKKNKLAKLAFNQVYASAYHLTNITKTKDLLLDVKCRIFDRTPLSMHFDFDLGNPQGGYTIDGSLGQFDLTHLNDFLTTVEGVSVSHGLSDGVNFIMHGNEYNSIGSINFSYDKLRVSYTGMSKMSSSIISTIINNAAVRKRNMPGVNFKRGIIHHQRDRSRSIFHSMSKSLQSGIAHTVLYDYIHK